MEKTTAKKSTQAANDAYRVVKSIYAKSQLAVDRGAPVAWMMTGCLAEELLKVLGIAPVYTENYAAVCAAKKAALSFLEIAESEGFSNLICGYARTGIGYASQVSRLGASVPSAPLGGMAHPTMMVGSSTSCDPRYKWYQAMGRYLDVPYYAFDTVVPSVDADLDQVSPYYIEYQLNGLKGLADFLEIHSGRKLDHDKLVEAVKISEQNHRLWWKCQMLRKSIPCPMPTEDMLSVMVPLLFDPADPETLTFYGSLLDEVKDRVANRVGVVPDEKYRLIWGGGLPPWHNMGIFNYFEQSGAVFVMETAYNQGPPLEAPSVSDPLERINLKSYNRTTYLHKRAAEGCGNPRVQLLLDWIDAYNADGIVMHGTVSCRINTIGQAFYQNMLKEHVKVPVLLIESDIIDERDYSESQMKSKIDAFLETVDNYKAHKSD